MADTMTATYTDPAGNVWDLTDDSNDSDWFTTFAVAGWGARPYTYTTDPLPRGGDTVRYIRAEAARLTWPLYIRGDDHMTWLANYRALKRAFLMTAWNNDAGTLTVTRPDGSARAIDVYYEAGFGGNAGENDLFALPVLTLMAPDGYWRDTVEQVEPRSYSVGSSFLNPFPTVSSAQVLGATTITNPGDVLAWPTWNITGPATLLTATNNTTGQSFTLTLALNTGDVATITTQQPTVRGAAGENLVGNLNWPTAYLWPLLSGTNSVTFTLSGAAAGSAVELRYTPRYEGA